jgi:tRNA threonylcarbamoyladenosine biosynthesis protein TsaB
VPRLLILETSGRPAHVALAHGENIVGVRRLDESRRHARDLAPAAASLLAEQGWKPRDVQGVIISRGPGSYTGLRVGIMSAKAFAYATGCAVIAVDTFAAIASQAPGQATRVAVLADAQQGKVYVQEFARGAGADPWLAVCPLTIRRFSEWLASVDAAVWLSGPGLVVHSDLGPAVRQVVQRADWDPWPESLLHLGLARYLAGERDDPAALEPLYLRPSSAEEKWDQRASR